MTTKTGGSWNLTAAERQQTVDALIGVVESGSPREQIAAGRLLLQMHEVDRRLAAEAAKRSAPPSQLQAEIDRFLAGRARKAGRAAESEPAQ